MDIASIHPYCYEKPGMTFVFPEKDGIFIQKIKKTRELMEKYGGADKKIWLTELGWPIVGAAGSKGVTEREQGDYLVRGYVLALSTGVVEKIFWYCFTDEQEANWGLIDKDYSPRLSYKAYSTMAKTLEGAQFSKKINIGEDAYCFEFRMGEEPVYVLWSVKDSRILSLNVNADKVKLIGIAGDTKEAESSNGVLTIPLSESPVYLLNATDVLNVSDSGSARKK